MSGPVESALDADLAGLSGSLVEQNTRTLAETARKLARTLDGDPGLVVAAVSRELRACLTALGLGGAGEPEDEDTAALLARLSSPVRDSAGPAEGDVRPRGRRAGGRDGEAAAAVAEAGR